MSKPKPALWRRAARIVLTAVLAVVLVALFYLAVILGQPQADDQAAVDLSQPLLAASPAQAIASEDQLGGLVAAFPVPVMSFVSGAGPALTAGTSYDTAFEDGFARVVKLQYALPDGGTVTARSIYPARALSLVGREGYRLNEASSLSLAGLRAVRMEGADTIRLHAQSSDALYVLTLPAMSADDLAALTKSLQLLTVVSAT